MAADQLVETGAGALEPDAMREWLIAMGTTVTAIAGWVWMLCEQPREVNLVTATDAIERNPKRLSELLANRPR